VIGGCRDVTLNFLDIAEGPVEAKKPLGWTMPPISFFKMSRCRLTYSSSCRKRRSSRCIAA
jgi:hypothetical protein